MKTAVLLSILAFCASKATALQCYECVIIRRGQHSKTLPLCDKGLSKKRTGCDVCYRLDIYQNTTTAIQDVTEFHCLTTTLKTQMEANIRAHNLNYLNHGQSGAMIGKACENRDLCVKPYRDHSLPSVKCYECYELIFGKKGRAPIPSRIRHPCTHHPTSVVSKLGAASCNYCTTVNQFVRNQYTLTYHSCAPEDVIYQMKVEELAMNNSHRGRDSIGYTRVEACGTNFCNYDGAKALGLTCYNCVSYGDSAGSINSSLPNCRGSLSPTKKHCEFCFRLDTFEQRRDGLDIYITEFSCQNTSSIRAVEVSIATGNLIYKKYGQFAAKLGHSCKSGHKCFKPYQHQNMPSVKCHECYDLTFGKKGRAPIPSRIHQPCSHQPGTVVSKLGGARCNNCTTVNQFAANLYNLTYHSCAPQSKVYEMKVKALAMNNSHRGWDSIGYTRVEACDTDFCNYKTETKATKQLECYECALIRRGRQKGNLPLCGGSHSNRRKGCNFCSRVDIYQKTSNFIQDVTEFFCLTTTGKSHVEANIRQHNSNYSRDGHFGAMIGKFCNTGNLCIKPYQDRSLPSVRCHECYDLHFGSKRNTDLSATTRPCSSWPRKVVNRIKHGEPCNYCTTDKWFVSNKFFRTYYSCASDQRLYFLKVEALATDNQAHGDSTIAYSTIKTCNTDFCTSGTTTMTPSLPAIFYFILSVLVSRHALS